MTEDEDYFPCPLNEVLQKHFCYHTAFMCTRNKELLHDSLNSTQQQPVISLHHLLAAPAGVTKPLSDLKSQSWDAHTLGQGFQLALLRGKYFPFPCYLLPEAAAEVAQPTATTRGKNADTQRCMHSQRGMQRVLPLYTLLQSFVEMTLRN